ncbi:MAG TPA: ribonuclease H-like YkuK family protein [Chitinophagaceae bacterium]|nr:ribonuclease H-like YkuK family protein [Chitinophagaceae bacterium]
MRKPIRKSVEEIIIREHALGNRLKVCIGTDSQVKGEETEFATVIVFLREGRGGFMLIHNFKTHIHYSIRERMLREVSCSIEIAYELCDLFTTYEVDMEVHADINTNPHFKSNEALREATGYILGMGFAFKAKPEAFASSSCANKMVN